MTNSDDLDEDLKAVLLAAGVGQVSTSSQEALVHASGALFTALVAVLAGLDPSVGEKAVAVVIRTIGNEVAGLRSVLEVTRDA